MLIEEIRPSLYHFRFPTQVALTKTFIRLQEFYESALSGIRGNFFTVEQYAKLYQEQQGADEFTYFTDWHGFNVPGEAIKQFMEIFRDRLRQCELDFFEQLSLVMPSWCWEKFYYVIATHVGHERDLPHETSHGYWYLHNEYKNQGRKLIMQLPRDTLRTLREKMAEKTYDPSVYQDEIMAYFATSDADYLQEKFGLDPARFHECEPFIQMFEAFDMRQRAALAERGQDDKSQ